MQENKPITTEAKIIPFNIREANKRFGKSSRRKIKNRKEDTKNQSEANKEERYEQKNRFKFLNLIIILLFIFLGAVIVFLIFFWL